MAVLARERAREREQACANRGLPIAERCKTSFDETARAPATQPERDLDRRVEAEARDLVVPAGSRVQIERVPPRRECAIELTEAALRRPDLLEHHGFRRLVDIVDQW